LRPITDVAAIAAIAAIAQTAAGSPRTIIGMQ